MTNDTHIKNIHDRLTLIQGCNYRHQGYTDIKINHENNRHEHPEDIGGYTPDLSAVFDSKITICDVETNESLNDSETILRWKAFSNSDCEFHLMVPKSMLASAKELAKFNKINVDKFWYSENC